MTNEELLKAAKDMVEKSLIDSTALATAGKLNPEQVDRYVTSMVDMTQLKGNVRIVRFRPEQYYIEKLGIGTRVSLPAAEATATSIRRGVSHSRITLAPKEIITPFELSTTYLEINLEGESVENVIVNAMALQTGNDIEELAINGDILGHARIESDLVDDPGASDTKVVKDSFMALFDGWLRKTDSANVYDAAGADISSTVMSRAMLKLPVKWRRIRRDMRYLVSMDHEQLYLEKLASRATALGDSAVEGGAASRPFGVPLVSVPLLEAEPLVVEHKTLGAAPSTVSLRYAPIGTDVTVTLQSLAGVPTTPYVETTDYTVDRTLGTLTNTAGPGALAAGADVKITYHSRGQFLFTNFANLIFAIGRDITIENDRDIVKRANIYVIHSKVDCEIEEVLAIVKGINVGIN